MVAMCTQCHLSCGMQTDITTTNPNNTETKIGNVKNLTVIWNCKRVVQVIPLLRISTLFIFVKRL